MFVRFKRVGISSRAIARGFFRFLSHLDPNLPVEGAARGMARRFDARSGSAFRHEGETESIPEYPARGS